MPEKQLFASEGLLHAVLRRPPVPAPGASGLLPGEQARPSRAPQPHAGAGPSFDFASLPIATAGSGTEAIAAQGVRGAQGPLPHLATIQPLFGDHDLRGVRAAIGGGAASAGRRLGAAAYAQGDRVGFRRSPDLFTAAHEAAHVVQQRSGRVAAGRAHPGDALEREADAAAQRVVRGESAAGGLGARAGGGAGESAGGAVQLKLSSVEEQLDLPIPEDDPEYRKFLESRGAGTIGSALARLGLRGQDAQRDKNSDVTAIGEFERIHAVRYARPAGLTEAQAQAHRARFDQDQHRQLEEAGRGQVVASRMLFEMDLGRLILDNVDLFAGPMQTVTRWMRAYLADLSELLGIEIERLDAERGRGAMTDAGMLRSLDDGLALRKLRKLKTLVDRLDADLAKARTPRALRDLHYDFTEKVYTISDEASAGLRREAGAATSLTPTTDKDVRKKVMMAPGSQVGAFQRRGRSAASLTAPEPLTDPSSGAERWNVFFYQPAAQEQDIGTGKLASPAKLERNKDGGLAGPNVFLWQQLTQHLMPVVAGVSGTMGDMIALGKSAGLSGDALWAYVMPQFGEMLAMRHHSFHEIAMVMRASIGGVEYTPGDYRGPLHPKLFTLPAFRMLENRYPELLLRGVNLLRKPTKRKAP